jgi:hypothetical protein
MTSTTSRRSRSTMTVPHAHPLRQLQSSIPATRTGAETRVAAQRQRVAWMWPVALQAEPT